MGDDVATFREKVRKCEVGAGDYIVSSVMERYRAGGLRANQDNGRKGTQS